MFKQINRSVSSQASSRLEMPKNINNIWDINQISQEFECDDDPTLKAALDLIQHRQVNQALNTLQEVVKEAKKYLGLQSHFQQVQQIINVVVSSAMSLLERDQSSALLLLLGCEPMLKQLQPKQQPQLRLQIQNGLGCYYKSIGQPIRALKELEAALALIKKFNLKEIAVTHLNLSVVLSLIEEYVFMIIFFLIYSHEGALENAKKAVMESHKQYQYFIKNHVSISQFKFQRCVSALAISFYNIGVQEQHFQRYQQALQAYASAFKVAEDNLGQQNYLTIQLKNVYEEFARQLAIAEAQKLTLSHKFVVRNKISLSRPMSSTIKPNQVITQNFVANTESKTIRPNSAASVRKKISENKIVDNKIEKRNYDFTIKTKMSRNNYFQEEEKSDPDVLKENIQNLKTQAMKEKEELIKIQEEKIKELQKLEALKYLGKSMSNKISQRGSVQTSRDQSMVVKVKTLSQPELSGEKDDDSDAKPLLNQQQLKSVRNLQIEIDQVSEFPQQVQSDYQMHFEDQMLSDINVVQEFQDGSPKQQDLNIIINQVDYIFSEKSKQFERMKVNENKIIFIQQMWRYHKQRFLNRVDSLTYHLVQKQGMPFRFNQYQGHLVIGMTNKIMEFTYFDFTILRKSQRKLQQGQIQQSLNHIFKFSVEQINSLDQQELSQYILQIKNLIHFDGVQLSLKFGDADHFIIQSPKNKKYIIQFQSQTIEFLDSFMKSDRPLSSTVRSPKSFKSIRSQKTLKSQNSLKSQKSQKSIKDDIQSPKQYDEDQNGQFNNQQIDNNFDDHQNSENQYETLQEIQQENQYENQQENQEENQQENDQVYIKDQGQDQHQDQDQKIIKEESYDQQDDDPKDNQEIDQKNIIPDQQHNPSQGSVHESRDNEQPSKEYTLYDRASGQLSVAENNYNLTDQFNNKDDLDKYQQEDYEQEAVTPQLNNGEELKTDSQDKVIEVEEEQEQDQVQEEELDQVQEEKQEKQITEQQQEEPPKVEDSINKSDLPDLMEDEHNSKSDFEEQQIINPDNFDVVGVIQAFNMQTAGLTDIEILYDEQNQLFVGRHQQWSLVSYQFKVENPEKTLANLQKYIKALIFEQKSHKLLRVYSKDHEKAVIKLQKKFKWDHYSKHFKFKLPKYQNVSGELYCGHRKGVIYCAVATPSLQKRQFYKFNGENYRQFVNKIQFRIINNLKYSEDKGIFLLQEPEHRILAQNPQAKILSLSPQLLKFEFVGYGLLNGIYDIVHQRIIIASDNRKVEAAQVDVPKTLPNDHLVQFAEKLLERSFIIQKNKSMSVIYYEQKDEDMVDILQKKILKYRTIRIVNYNLITIQNGILQQRKFKVELQQKIVSFYAIACDDKIYELGKLQKDKKIKLLHNFKKLISLFGYMQDGLLMFQVDEILNFLQKGDTNNLMRLDMKEFISYVKQVYSQETKITLQDNEALQQMNSLPSENRYLSQVSEPSEFMYFSKIKDAAKQ